VHHGRSPGATPIALTSPALPSLRPASRDRFLLGPYADRFPTTWSVFLILSLARAFLDLRDAARLPPIAEAPSNGGRPPSCTHGKRLRSGLAA